MSKITQGERVADDTAPHLLKPGEYLKIPYKSEEPRWPGKTYWMCCTPNGLLGNLLNHNIVENEDKTITVSPSILVKGGNQCPTWHGYLEKGVWREC